MKSNRTGLFTFFAYATPSSRSKNTLNPTGAFNDSLCFTLDGKSVDPLEAAGPCAFKMKSWVFIGGASPLSTLTGAPHNPGTMYTAKENDRIAKNNLGTETYFRSLSCANLSLPSR
ncbi:hypothetical protein D3C80_1575320 [compost metagenome]